jgi:hypothetical protein
MERRIVTGRNHPRVVLGCAFLALAAAAAAAHIIDRNRLTWYVEAGLERQWRELLEKAPTPPPFTRRSVFDPAVGTGKGRGVIISKTFPAKAAEGDTAPSAEGPWEPPLRLYPGLYRDGCQGAIPLALDPWLVFRKTGDPPLTLERVLNPAGGAGNLILPGAESNAVHAWVTQLVQESPGNFPREKQAWDEAEQRLIYGNTRFQQGALTYTWFDLWILLLGNESAWAYAPLSMTRDLSPYDAGRLDGALFPIPRDWNTYGLQAEVLWAIPKVPGEEEAQLDQAKLWLSAAETQTLIAEILGWIPAGSGGKPRDTLARQAQVAWFSSSFVWQ